VEVIQKKYDIILNYEESLAGAVAIGVLVRKPLTVWHFLVPFIFMYDFFRMKVETTVFTRNFLFTKKLALDAAFEINKGEDRQSKLARIERETRDWLTSQKFYSWRIHQGQIKEANLLLDHYLKLLGVEGESYPSLVKSAYQNQAQFEFFQRQLTALEREIDQAVMDTLGVTEEIWESMSIKQTVIDKIRTEEVRKLFQ